jgi:hypothetical protein
MRRPGRGGIDDCFCCIGNFDVISTAFRHEILIEFGSFFIAYCMCI